MLLEVTAGQRPFISIYLDMRSNENGKKTFDVFLKKQISERLDLLSADLEERKYANTLKATSNGSSSFWTSSIRRYRVSRFLHAPQPDLLRRTSFTFPSTINRE
jgi:hypothetical protein